MKFPAGSFPLRRWRQDGASDPSRKFSEAVRKPRARAARGGVHGGRFGFVFDFAGLHAGARWGGRLRKEQHGAVPIVSGEGYGGADMVFKGGFGRAARER